MSSIFAVGVSVGVGILCAIKRYTAVDRFFSSFLVFCASVPPFLVAIVFLLVFSMKLKWFPSFGVAGNFLQNFRYLTLPSIALGMGTITLMGRMTRDRMIDELQSNYALTEVAKGTPWRRIVLRHCFRNTVIPVLTIGSLELGKNIVDAVLVEKVFALGGIGELLIEGIKGADYPLVQCVVLLMVAIFLFINLSVDIVYALVDPRIRAINASSPNQL
jgi:peptide/nickel transport system permease protein